MCAVPGGALPVMPKRNAVPETSDGMHPIHPVAPPMRGAESVLECVSLIATSEAPRRPRPTARGPGPGELRKQSCAGFSCAKRVGAVAIEIQPPLRAHTHDDAHASKRGPSADPVPRHTPARPPPCARKNKKTKNTTHTVDGGNSAKNTTDDQNTKQYG